MSMSLRYLYLENLTIRVTHMIRKDELTYHVSVDPMEYKLNSLLRYVFKSLTVNGKMGIHNFYNWNMLFPYFVQPIKSPRDDFS